MKRLFTLTLFFMVLSGGLLQAQTDSTQSEDPETVPIAKARKERVPLSEKIVIGGSIGASFGNYTNINLSPIIGYKVTEDLILGAGPTYIYSSIKTNGYKFEYSVYGGRLYGRQKVYQNLYVQAEYEMLNVQNYLDVKDPDARKWIMAPLIGASYVQPLGSRSSVTLTFLYNLNYQAITPYTNPIIRLGFNL